jgi:hypothetical protein
LKENNNLPASQLETSTKYRNQSINIPSFICAWIRTMDLKVRKTGCSPLNHVASLYKSNHRKKELAQFARQFVR